MKNSTWRLVANRANSQHSTGPKTPEGKAVSARNSTKHGLSSKQVVIPGEDPDAYETHRAELTSALKPANAVESDLIEELAANSWRLKRAHRIETAILAEIAAGSPDADVAIAKAFMQQPKELDRLIRYMTSIERAYWRVFNKLEAIQRARREHESQQAIEQASAESVKPNTPAQPDSNGFVLQSAEDTAVVPALPQLQVAAAGQSLTSSAQ